MIPSASPTSNPLANGGSINSGTLTVKSGASIVIASGATITNNGTATGFGAGGPVATGAGFNSTNANNTILNYTDPNSGPGPRMYRLNAAFDDNTDAPDQATLTLNYTDEQGRSQGGTLYPGVGSPQAQWVMAFMVQPGTAITLVVTDGAGQGVEYSYAFTLEALV